MIVVLRCGAWSTIYILINDLVKYVVLCVLGSTGAVRVCCYTTR